MNIKLSSHCNPEPRGGSGCPKGSSQQRGKVTTATSPQAGAFYCYWCPENPLDAELTDISPEDGGWALSQKAATSAPPARSFFSTNTERCGAVESRFLQFSPWWTPIPSSQQWVPLGAATSDPLQHQQGLAKHCWGSGTAGCFMGNTSWHRHENPRASISCWHFMGRKGNFAVHEQFVFTLRSQCHEML